MFGSYYKARNHQQEEVQEQEKQQSRSRPRLRHGRSSPGQVSAFIRDKDVFIFCLATVEVS